LLQKHFSAPPMSVSQKPISYLLILADLLQEWSRESFSGELTRSAKVTDVKIDFTNDCLNIVFFVNDDGVLDCEAIKSKIEKILDYSDFFVDISIEKEHTR